MNIENRLARIEKFVAPDQEWLRQTEACVKEYFGGWAALAEAAATVRELPDDDDPDSLTRERRAACIIRLLWRAGQRHNKLDCAWTQEFVFLKSEGAAQ
jgi:hypothetical protein